MFRTFAKAAIAALALIGLLVTVPAGATAAWPATPVAATGDVGTQGYADCPAWSFCIWDGLGGTGNMEAWTGVELPCDFDRDLRATTPKWADRIRSIKNNTSGSMVLYNRVVGQTHDWDAVWPSVEGNYGDLPASAQRNVDRIEFICT